MSNIKIYIIVEGQTEQTFVRDIFAPDMAAKGIFCYPILIGKTGHKGGDVRFDRAKINIRNSLKYRSNNYVSTMFDYFGINKNWPGLQKLKQRIQKGTTFSATEKANFLEKATLTEIINLFPDCNAEKRFIPYISMHEFEALLFSDADILAEKLKVEVDIIKKILDEYNNKPEEINDNPVKAPSKRLESFNSGYIKPVMGKIISERIGIQTIRNKCPHFNDWLIKLENIRQVSLNR